MGAKINDDDREDDELEDDELEDGQDPDEDEETEDDDPEDGDDADLEGLTPEEITAKLKAERLQRREGESAVEALKRENAELRKAKEPAGDQPGQPTNRQDPELAALLGQGVQALRNSKDPKDKVTLAIADELSRTQRELADGPNIYKIRRHAGDDEEAQEKLLEEVRGVQRRTGAPNMGVAFQLWKGEQFDKGATKSKARTAEVKEEITRRRNGVKRTGSRPVGGAKTKAIPSEMDDGDYQKLFNGSSREKQRELLTLRREGKLSVRPPAPRG